MKKIFFTFSLIFLFFSCSAQQKATINEQVDSRTIADSILKVSFKDVSSEILLLSISDKWFLIIVNNKNNYEQFFVQINSKNIIQKKMNGILKPDPILDKAFDLNQYDKNFKDFNSVEYKDYRLAQGNETYFVLKDKQNNRFGEFNLSVIIDPTPIGKDIYYYLVSKLLNEVSKN